MVKDRKQKYVTPHIELIVCPDICTVPVRQSYDLGDGNCSTIYDNPDLTEGPNYGGPESTKQTTLWDFKAWDDIE